MKLCYLWVEKFRNFKNFGLNLSSSRKFKYDRENNTLLQTKIPQLPTNFFGETITDVVGIIGKNGVGKSNAVELICKVLKGAKTSLLQTDFFFIVEQENILEGYYSFANLNHPKAIFNISFINYSGTINPLKVVYFSNVFDERRNEFDKDIADISLNNAFLKNNHSKRNEPSDFEKQIRLINSRVFPLLNIDLPSNVQITSKIWTNRFGMINDRHFYGDQYRDVQTLKKLFRDRLRETKPENKFIHLLRIGFFLDLYNHQKRRSRYTDETINIEFFNLNEFVSSLTNLRTEEISEKLIDYLDEMVNIPPMRQMALFDDSEQGESQNLQKEELNKQIAFLGRNLKKQLEDFKIDYNSEGSRGREFEYFIFDYSNRKSKKFITEFVTLFGRSSVFTVNWLGISSGHKAYLNLFASLFQELRYTKQINLLLCIDEGDLYLHPKWQVEFFDRLITVLPRIFSGIIQLVLTSHSPFLLSDLPKQNITILDKSASGSSLDGIDLTINTLGGNLYDLYSEPFFLGTKRDQRFCL